MKPGERPLKTLERVLSKAGLGSRTEARSWIGAGRVTVNGKVVQSPDQWVDLERDRVAFDGKPVREAKRIYLLLYKPKGYLTTYQDPEGRATVYDLLKDIKEWVFPVGRLDLETSGLLLLTNDTRFAEIVTNPDHKVAKTYLVKSNMLHDDEQLDRLRHGIELNDGLTRPAQVKRIRDTGGRTVLEITITEGRNRQVRRMIEALGGKVLKLVRTSIGQIPIGELPIGQWRELAMDEVRSLLPAAQRVHYGGSSSKRGSSHVKPVLHAAGDEHRPPKEVRRDVRHKQGSDRSGPVRKGRAKDRQ